MTTVISTARTVRVRHGALRRTFLRRDGLLVNPPGAAAAAPVPCIQFAGLTDDAWGGQTLTYEGAGKERVATDEFLGAHTRVVLHFHDPRRKLLLRWCFRLFDKAPGWESFIEATTQSLPMGDWRKENREDRLDTLPCDVRTATLHLADFRPATDYHNTFVTRSVHRYKGNDPLYLDGNVLRVEQADGTGIVLVKLGPSRHDRREKVQATFRVTPSGVTVLGWGIEPHEFVPGQMLRSHSLVVVPYSDGEPGAVRALRAFFRRRWAAAFRAPTTIMVNPWGGGGRYLYDHMTEKWVIEEIEAAAKIGATHYQIDDGWQAGGTLIDIAVKGALPDNAYWKVHPGKFPRSLTPIAAAGRKNGIGLGLWFLPDLNTDYRSWKSEARLLADFHGRFGISYFKIDGVMHRTKAAEDSLDALLREVRRRTGHRVLFNLDVTAGQRLGFFHAPGFGPMFPANRYPHSPVEAANKYHPQNTLRNFWQLAHFIPSHLIQVEVPNILFDPAEFADKFERGYKPDDVHDPRRYGLAYCAAISLFGAPLLWLQPSRVKPEVVEAYSQVMALHRAHRDRIVAGDVFPVGDEPNGTSITGFASVTKSGGYVVVYREVTPHSRTTIRIPFAKNGRVRLLLSNTETSATLTKGVLHVRLKQPRSFGLYQWER
ncbi:MAG: hypothetical protein A3K19_02365 [Lentisphaerae bacterium RIFOXYB12_FULL_65_16]|nr:MAG: hypothetical protein A3K18_13090 [Lentisphaerae bacterium RIFOXYA12_64_32]OGV86722.1 MAG: hypothetical protein A3K19_02365 [Lentisphaerae bacterium RIFOXYB12_FULL_65_16]